MKKFLIICVILFSLPIYAADVNFFKLDSITTYPHAANLRSNAIEAFYIFSTDDSKHYMAFNCAVKIPFLTVIGDTMVFFETGGYGGLYTRFELLSENFNFVHADFLGSYYFDIRYKLITFETSIYHVSSHLGDDYIRYNKGKVKNTGFEAVREFMNIRGGDFVEITLGFDYKFFKRPENRIFNNQSVFHGWRFDFVTVGVPLYVEWEGEVLDFRHIPNIGIRIGCYLDYIINNLFLGRDSYRKKYQEFFAGYYYGYSKMNCFYTKREQLVMTGCSFRL